MRRSAGMVYCLGVCLAGAWGLPALAASAALPEAGAVYAFAAPKAGFRPVAASDAELRAYGLPPRPHDRSGAGYAAWVRMMSAARVYVAPVLRADPRIHGPARGPVRTDASNVSSNNWAGQALQNSVGAYGTNSFVESMAQWVLSGVQQAVGSCGGTDVSATWVGLDGLATGSGDVAQAGTEQDASCSAGRTTQDVYAWFEWYPATGYQITNFPVVTGGSVFVVVEATSARSAVATFVNLQTGAYTNLGFNAPGGTALKGNSAEWVVERPDPGNSTSPGTLADFGEIPMESEIAYLYGQTSSGPVYTPGQTGPGQSSVTLTMQTASGVTLATTVPQGGSAQLVQVAGPTK